MDAHIGNSRVAVSHSQRALELRSESGTIVARTLRESRIRIWLPALLAVALGACGGGSGGYGNDGGSANNPPPPAQNGVPTANAGEDADVTEGQTATLSGSGSDPDGDPISYEWTQFAGDSVTLSDARASSTTFTAPATDVDLDLGFRLTVRDVNGGTATDDVIIHVANDDPPVADAGANQTVDEQSLVALDGTASFDPDGEPTTYQWTQVSGAAARLDDATSASPGFTAPIVSATSQLTFELAVTDTNDNTASDTVIVTVQPVPTGPIPADPDRFLAFLNQSSPIFQESQASADAYYAAVDPLSEKTTLDAWKSANGFDDGNDAHAVYRNTADLGFGRVMSIRSNADGSVAAYVENYDDLEIAIAADESGIRDGLIATVAMEYSAHPDDPNGVKYTKFYTFDGNDDRATQLDLDGRGPKFQPGLCVVCHGGQPKALVNGVYPDNGDTGAQFLPWDVDTFEYSDNPLYTLEAQEFALKELNRIATLTYPAVNAAAEGTWDGESSRELIEGWYGGAALPNPEFDPVFVPPGWRTPDNGGPVDNPDDVEDLYLTVVGPHCRACHSQRGRHFSSAVQGEFVDFSSYENFIAYREQTIETVYDHGTMPNALVTFESFWTETDGVVPAEVLGVHLGINATIRRPGRPIADPGPAREAPIGNVALTAEASQFAESFAWSFASANGRPSNSQASIAGENTRNPTLTTDVAGGYRIELVVSDGVTESEPAVTTITSFDAIDERSFSDDIEPIFITDCQTCHSTGLATSVPGIPALFDNPLTRYDEVIAYVNFDDIAASPIITKPLGQQHGAGATPREGFDLSGGIANKDSYDALLQWISEGAADN